MKDTTIPPMFLPGVESANGDNPYQQRVRHMRDQGIPVPQILHLLGFRFDRTEHLTRFTQGVMRGDSPLSAGMRELIAAFTSRKNECRF